MNTHNLEIDFGKHKGEKWTRVPVSYLKWLSNETDGERKLLAESELKRRGTTTPSTLELSGHAIDRASQITKEWQDVGVHSWLQKIAEEAIIEGNRAEQITYKGYKFSFAYGEYYPLLKTIIKE